MNVTIKPSAPNGKIKAIASKSSAHRLLICAAFASKQTEIVCEEHSKEGGDDHYKHVFGVESRNGA